MIEKAKVMIKGEEYIFIKPYACDLIEIEDECMSRDGFDEFLFNKLVLRLVSAKIDINELVEFNEREVELSSGDKILTKDVGYEKYKKGYKSLEKRGRVSYCKELLKINGVNGAIDLKSFTYEDITKLAEAYVDMYNDSELTEVIETVSGFCFPEKA